MADKDKSHKDAKRSGSAAAEAASPNKGTEAYNNMRKRGESITTEKAQTDLPDEKTINDEFVPLAARMGLKEDQIAKMTPLQKWTTVLQFQEKQSDSTTLENKPSEVVKELEKGKNKLKTLVRVRTLLTTETVDWCSNFIALKGHQRLFEIFVATSEKKAGDKEKELLAECCRCMKALMNTSEGFQKALEFEPSVRLLIQSLEMINIVSQAQVLYLLAAVCVVSPEAHNRVLVEMRRVNQYPVLMDNFKLKDEQLLTATLTYINALTGSLRDTETRVTLRNEFVRMNIKDHLSKIVAQHPKEDLLVQIKIFEDGLESDRGNFTASGGISSEDWEKHQAAFDELKAKYEKLQTQFHSLEFEKTNIEQEMAKLKAQMNAMVQAAASGQAVAPGGDGAVAPPPPGGGGDTGAPPPPPPPGGDGGPPPPPPPPGGDGGPPPPPPPPGGSGGPPPPPPPPGGPGGPPPPPPPPGGPGGPPPPPGAPAKVGRPAKPKRKPNRKMKGFVWNKIADNKIDNTVWEKTDDMKVHFDTNEFERLFGEREKEVAPEPLSPRGGEAPAKVEKKQKIQLLDPKRSNNCSIMLRGVKMSPADIKKAVANFDDSVLKEDQLRSIKDFVPTPEEMQMLKDYTGDKNELGAAEQFMLEIMSVPGFGAKVNAMLFRIQFTEKSDVAKTEINLLSKAIDSLKGNKKFQDLLEIVLAFGNYLNGQSNRGGCWGVRLNSLPKMLEVKSADGKLTLMHYFVDFVSKKHKELLTLLEELKSSEEACRLNIRETTSKVTELKTGFASLEAQLNAPDADAKLKSAMGPFAEKAKETVAALDSRVSKLEPAFKEILAYYGEPAATETEDFFGTIAAFIGGMSRAIAENAKRVELQAKEEKARALQAELKTKAVGGAMKKKGHIDDAIEGMKSGKLFQRMSVRMDKV